MLTLRSQDIPVVVTVVDKNDVFAVVTEITIYPGAPDTDVRVCDASLSHLTF